jgi:hypothetical protein
MEFIGTAKRTLGGIYQQIMGISYGEKLNNNFMEFMKNLYGEFDEQKLRTEKIEYDRNNKIIKRIKMKDARKLSNV